MNGCPPDLTENSTEVEIYTTSLVVSPDDFWVCLATSDGTIHLRQVHNDQHGVNMKQQSSVSDVLFSEDGDMLLTAGFKHIFIWSIVDGTLITTLTNHQSAINKMVFTAEGRCLVTCGEDKRILVWDFRNRMTIDVFHACCAVKNIAVTTDGGEIFFTHKNLAYFSMLKANKVMQNVLDGVQIDVPESVQKAQALALAFSGQQIISKTSQSCVIV